MSVTSAFTSSRFDRVEPLSVRCLRRDRLSARFQRAAAPSNCGRITALRSVSGVTLLTAPEGAESCEQRSEEFGQRSECSLRDRRGERNEFGG